MRLSMIQSRRHRKHQAVSQLTRLVQQRISTNITFLHLPALELLCRTKLRTHNMLFKEPLLRTTTLLLLPRQLVDISLVLALLRRPLFLSQLPQHRPILEPTTSRARSLSLKLLLRGSVNTNSTSNLSPAHRLRLSRTDMNTNSTSNPFLDQLHNLLRTDRNMSNTSSLSLAHRLSLLRIDKSMNSTLRLFLVHPSHQQNRLRPPRRCQVRPIQLVNTTLRHLGSHPMFNQGWECLLHLNMPLSKILLLHCRTK